MPRISLIGAGTATFSLNLVRDLCLTRNLRDSVICLMDVNPERLENSYLLCTRYAEEVGINLTVEKTLDRREALRGADFVINTALAASHDRLQEGWNVAYRHGYHFGGSAHVMHDEAFWINWYQLRLMDEIVRDMQEICPDAWLVLVANPVLAGVTYLSRAHPGAKIVGMCHGYAGVYYLAHRLGLDRERIGYEIPGVNHFVWLNEFTYDGKDAYPLLDAWIEKESEDYFRRCGRCDGMGPKAIDLYRRFGRMPIGDTGNPGGGAWGYWYHESDAAQARWKEDPWIWYQGYFTGGLANVARIHTVAHDRSVRVSDVFARESSNEPMVPLIEALACNVERTVVVNIANDGGFVPGVPADFEVEIPATVNASGIHGHVTKPLPERILTFLRRDCVEPVECELRAFASGNRDDLIDLLLMDPWTRSADQAVGLLDDILALPYHSEMNERFSAKSCA